MGSLSYWPSSWVMDANSMLKHLPLQVVVMFICAEKFFGLLLFYVNQIFCMFTLVQTSNLAHTLCVGMLQCG